MTLDRPCVRPSVRLVLGCCIQETFHPRTFPPRRIGKYYKPGYFVPIILKVYVKSFKLSAIYKQQCIDSKKLLVHVPLASLLIKRVFICGGRNTLKCKKLMIRNEEIPRKTVVSIRNLDQGR